MIGVARISLGGGGACQRSAESETPPPLPGRQLKRNTVLSAANVQKAWPPEGFGNKECFFLQMLVFSIPGPLLYTLLHSLNHFESRISFAAL